MKDKNHKYHWLLIGILMVLMIMVIDMTWYFTSQSAQVSETMSMSIVNRIESTVAENFGVNRNDYFWRITMDVLVRKGAHLSEYILLGLITCILFKELFHRIWLAATISLMVCSMYAYIDEYRQNFFTGRGPTWFDWKIDVSGAIIGIIMATIVLLIVQYIHKLKAQIRELEDRLDEEDDHD